MPNKTANRQDAENAELGTWIWILDSSILNPWRPLRLGGSPFFLLLNRQDAENAK